MIERQIRKGSACCAPYFGTEKCLDCRIKIVYFWYDVDRNPQFDFPSPRVEEHTFEKD
jgi:hypothetical protein